MPILYSAHGHGFKIFGINNKKFLMFKAFKYRIYPSDEQATLLNKHIGASRFVYNLALETKIAAYQGNKVSLSYFDMTKQLTDLKKECEWLMEINSQTLIASLKDLDSAYKNFFERKAGFPKYKSKWKGKQSFRVQQKVQVVGDRLMMPKFKKKGIKIKLHRPLVGEIKNVTISRASTGKYFASILCDTGIECVAPSENPSIENMVGIDLGIKDFLTTSDGEVVNNPKFLRKSESKLKYTQRKYSKHKGVRTKKKLAKLHEKVANQRNDFLHKQSSKLVKECRTIAIEDLNVKGMLGSHYLAKSISDAGWSAFTTMLKYKCKWYGTTLLKIGKFEPSSKTCSICGVINKELTLEDREWTCSSCGSRHHRDINAAINIKNFALKTHVSGSDTKKSRRVAHISGSEDS